MASNRPESEVDCTCSICCDLFNDPVVLLCGHSFCKLCLQEWWKQSRMKTCPVCKELFPMAQPPRNLALKNLSETLRQERERRPAGGTNDLCPQHGEKLRLFCKDDQQLICLVCRDAREHKQHNYVPIKEAVEEYRAQVKLQLLHLKSTKGSFERTKENWLRMNLHIQVQAQRTESRIKAEFQKMFQFLRAEETLRIDACRKEAKLKSEKMNVRIINLTAEISELTKNIKSTEEKMREEELSFMLNVKRTLKRSLCELPDPEAPVGALIDEAKHIGNLQYCVWKKMADLVQYTPVILDPNTASTSLTVSENLSSSRETEKYLPLPHNPERLGWSDVLGYKGFTSGKHCWDVEVSGYWAVGVANDKPDSSGQNTWAMYMCPCTNILRTLTMGDYITVIAEDSFPEKVRVYLDYDKGNVSFWDLNRKKTVYTINYKFTERVFPYFRTNVNILPVQISVNLNHPRSC